MQSGAVLATETAWQPRSSWRRSRPRWRRAASSNGRRRRASRRGRRRARRGRDRQGGDGAGGPGGGHAAQAGRRRRAPRCRCRQLVAVIGEPGEAVDGRASRRPARRQAPARRRQPSRPTPTPRPRRPPAAPRRPPAPPPAPSPRPSRRTPAAPGGRVKASPLARRIAAERGIDLGGVAGTGPEGRIVQRDLETAPAAAARAGAAPRPPAPRPVVAALPAAPPFTDVPLTQIRKTIAKRLAQSIGPIPTFYLTTEVDMERVVGGARGAQGAWATGPRSRSTTSSSRPSPPRSGSTRPATPGGRTTTSATGTRCTSAWRWRSRTA